MDVWMNICVYVAQRVHLKWCGELAFGNIEHLKECVKVEKRNIKEEEGVTHREHKEGCW
jgi:hypothetical protein